MAEAAGFASSSNLAVGKLLATLTAQRREGVIAEIGTGYGVGAAWIALNLAPGVRFVTVELDEARAAATQKLFQAYPNVTVLQGDWKAILDYSPFELIFADAAAAKVAAPELLVEALAPGGNLLLDDFTPEHIWTEEQRRMWANDPVRALWLNHPRLVSTEIMVTPTSSAILATRRANQALSHLQSPV